MRGRGDVFGALFTIVAITAVYAFVSYSEGIETPPSSGLFGHIVGVIGFILMLMTETLYSLRKRYRRAAEWGRMESWLKFHVFTGLVGPYMVLLHTAWNFNGLAGAVTLLMVIIVASGFVGRYIYTLAPRTAAEIELQGADVEHHLKDTEMMVQRYCVENWTLFNTLSSDLVGAPHVSANPWAPTGGRFFAECRFRWRWWLETRHLGRGQLRDLRDLLDFRRQLYYQINSMLLARRMLAVWHAVHVPLSIALFIMAFAHIGAALYYVTLAK
jgi:hypothetical protein